MEFRTRLLCILILLGTLSSLRAATGAERARNGKAAEDSPLFSFTLLADIHLRTSLLPILKQAFACIDGELQSDFTIFLGDNCGYAPHSPGAGADEAARDRARHRCFKELLDNHLRTRALVLPGDNWAARFEEVFGAARYSFDYGGAHFILASLDRDAFEGEGCADLSEEAQAWLSGELARNADRPVLFFMHEPVAPRAFLGAERTAGLFAAHPSLVAAFSGHLHESFSFTRERLHYRTLPSFGLSPGHPFRSVTVHADRICVRELHYDPAGKRFVFAGGRDVIPLPAGLTGALHPPRTPELQNYTAMPPAPRRRDPQLAGRHQELLWMNARFLRTFLTEKLGASPPAASGAGTSLAPVGIVKPNE